VPVERIGRGRIDHSAGGTNRVRGGVPRIRIVEGQIQG